MSDKELLNEYGHDTVSKDVRHQGPTVSPQDQSAYPGGGGDIASISQASRTEEGSPLMPPQEITGPSQERKLIQPTNEENEEAGMNGESRGPFLYDIPYHDAMHHILHHITRDSSNGAKTELLKNLNPDLLTYGMPEIQLKLYIGKGYVSLVDPTRNHPLWVLWQMKSPSEDSSAETVEKNDSRTRFRFVDGGKYTKAATDADYLQSGYTRGHCKDCHSAETDENLEETFHIPANIFPQNRDNNEGIWQMLERFCHKILQTRMYELLVFVLPIMKANSRRGSKLFLEAEVIGSNEVLVPTHLCKVVVAIDKNDKTPKYMNAWMIPNEPIDRRVPLSSYECSLDTVKRFSGFKLFPNLDVDSLSKGVLCEYGGEDKEFNTSLGSPKGIQIPAPATNKAEQAETGIEYLQWLASVLFCSFSFGYLPDPPESKQLLTKMIRDLKRTGLVILADFNEWTRTVDSQVRQLWGKGEKAMPEFVEGLIKEVSKPKTFSVIDLSAHQTDGLSVKSLLNLHYKDSETSHTKAEVQSKHLMLCLPQGHQKTRISIDLCVDTQSSVFCMCGQQNMWFCITCQEDGRTVEESSYCDCCYEVEHKKIKKPHCTKQKIVILKLKAVVCTGEKLMTYCATGNKKVTWALFDSMAKLRGGEAEVRPLFDVEYWLTKRGWSKYENEVCQSVPTQSVPTDIKPLFESPSVCFYG